MTATETAAVGRRATPTGLLVLPSSATREDWLTARRAGITATDLPKIVGASKYGSAADVYADKTGAPLVDDELSEAGEWGTLLEDTVAREWADRAGVTVRRVGLIGRVDDPWSLASLDRLVTGCPRGRCALEVKTRNQWVADQWADGVPDPVLVQVLWQLHVSGLDHIHVAALIGGQRLIEHTVLPDLVTTEYLIEQAWEVWRCVLDRRPPVVDPALLTVDLIDRIYPNREGVRNLTGADAVLAAGLLDQYRQAGDDEKVAQAVKAAAKVQLLDLLGDGEDLQLDGRTVVTYRASKATPSISADEAKRLAEERPDVFAEYGVVKPGSRRFTPKKAA